MICLSVDSRDKEAAAAHQRGSGSNYGHVYSTLLSQNIAKVVEKLQSNNKIEDPAELIYCARTV